MKPVWNDVLSERDRRVVNTGTWGRHAPLGKSPCVLVIDAQVVWLGRSADAAEAARWPRAGGPEAWEAVRATRQLLEAARGAGVPVLYTRQVHLRSADYDVAASVIEDGSGEEWSQIVREVAPQEGDLVVEKTYASGFYGTPLQSYLTAKRIDTILFAGGSAGGCVEASLVEARARGYVVAMVQDCVFDRLETALAMALLETWMKHGHVLELGEAMEYVKTARRQHADA